RWFHDRYNIDCSRFLLVRGCIAHGKRVAYPNCRKALQQQCIPSDHTTHKSLHHYSGHEADGRFGNAKPSGKRQQERPWLFRGIFIRAYLVIQERTRDGKTTLQRRPAKHAVFFRKRNNQGAVANGHSPRYVAGSHASVLLSASVSV